MECLNIWRRIINHNHSPLFISRIALSIVLSITSMAQVVYAADEAVEGDQVRPKAGTSVEQKEPAAKDKKASGEDVDTLPEVSVTDTKVKEESGINSTQSITTITSEQLQRTQSSNIFEAVRSTPGVSITGGPRASGMTFSIRGYSDNEDVMVRVDGAPKGFEKYRMGGTFIEPELLKSIEVQRGPQIASGSGSLGGTIIAQTKNASDLLKPGQKFGAKAKFGYGNNNDEYSRSYMLFARPHERVDILYNYSNRQSNNITLRDGTKLESSAIESISELLKVSLFLTDDIELSTSLVTFKDTGLQPYDATGGQPGSFGNVIRSIDDFSWTETLTYTPDSPWVNLKAVVGGGYTNLHDLMPPGFGVNPVFDGCDGIVYTPFPAIKTLCSGDMNDYYKFKTRNIDISNTALLFDTKTTKISLLTGWQYNESDRQVERIVDNPVITENKYPQGLNPAAPPGKKAYRAFYLQPNFQFGQFNIKPGYRRDDYEITSAGITKEALDDLEQPHKVKFTQETVSLGLAYDFFPRNSPQQLTLYSNYGQGFRPPLIDEYFTLFGNSIGARCPPGNPLSFGGFCVDNYRPQESESTEAGISYQNARFLGSEIGIVSKLNFFHIYTSNLLISMAYDPVSGSYRQDGWERRNGVEFESFLQYRNWFMRGSYSRTTGERFDGVTQVPLYTVPGKALNLNVGVEIVKGLDVNVSYRKISDRNVIVSGDGTPANAFVYGIQDGYEMWNAGVHWQVNPTLGLRLIGENLTNNENRYDSAFGGLGIQGPGRNIKFFAELMY